MRKFLAILLVLIMAMTALPLSAQEDTLTEEERALLEEVVGVSETVRGYGSYVEDALEIQTSTLILRQGDTILQQQATTETTQSRSTYIRGENPNGQYIATITVDDSAAGRSALQGELRYVDGVLYGSAAIIEGGAEVTLPAGFVVIADPATDETFPNLEPEDFVRSVLGEENEENPLNDLELLSSVVTSVTSEEVTWNEIPANVVTLEIPAANLFTLLQESGSESFQDPTTAALFSFVSPESLAVLRLYRDAEGNPLSFEGEFNIMISNVAMTQLDPSAPADAFLDMSIVLTETSNLSSVNQALEPIAAPQVQ